MNLLYRSYTEFEWCVVVFTLGLASLFLEKRWWIRRIPEKGCTAVMTERGKQSPYEDIDLAGDWGGFNFFEVEGGIVVREEGKVIFVEMVQGHSRRKVILG